MLSALGVKGLDRKGNELSCLAEDLYKLNQIDWSNFNPRLNSITITVANDVSNPLCGQDGASHIYFGQEGKTDKQIKKLDEALFNFAREVERYKQK